MTAWVPAIGLTGLKGDMTLFLELQQMKIGMVVTQKQQMMKNNQLLQKTEEYDICNTYDTDETGIFLSTA